MAIAERRAVADNGGVIRNVRFVMSPRRVSMKRIGKILAMAAAPLIGASSSHADALVTHRIPAPLAAEAVSEAVAACAKDSGPLTVRKL